jgi:hypothetical protein
MNDHAISLAALVEVHSVLREIHEIVGPNPRAVIPGKLYSRLVSAEATMDAHVTRIARKIGLEVLHG